MKMPLIKQACTIVRNEYFTCITADSVFRSSRLDPCSYNQIISNNTSETEIGSCVKKALLNSRFLTLDEVRHWQANGDDSAEIWFSEMFNFTGGLDKKSILKKMHRIFVRQQDGIIKMSPTHHNKLESWVGHPIHDPVEISQFASEEEIGRTVNSVFDMCK